MKPIRKLLIIRLSALGDICLTLPVIDSVCRAYPNVSFTFLTSKMGKKIADLILTGLPNLQVIGINKNEYRGIGGPNRLYRELKPQGYDAVADLHGVLRSHWIDIRYRLTGHMVARIDKGHSEKKALVAHAIHRQLTTSVERYRQVFADMGMRFALDFHASEVRTRLAAVTPALSPSGHFHVGIAPFAQHTGKMYPANQMADVIDQLLEAEPRLHLYLFGSQEERAILEAWTAKCPARIDNMAAHNAIEDDLYCMSHLDLIVSMDSANMHLASLVGLRCLSIWGATHRHTGFLGYGQRAEDCIELPLSCRPCSVFGNKACKKGNYECLTQLRPAMVTQRILDALSSPAPLL